MSGCSAGWISKNPERDAAIIEAYTQGQTVQAISAAYGLHVRRIRIILDRGGALTQTTGYPDRLRAACNKMDRAMSRQSRRRFDVEAEVPGIGMVRHMVVAMDMPHLILKIRRSYPIHGVQVRSVIEMGRGV